MTLYRKKLIEVALPLEAINKESAREKSIRHGHPSTLHLWWARRPLATCRAVLFASLVDDPSSLPEQFPTEEAQEVERQRLFRIIEELVKWDNVSGGDHASDPEILAKARAEILRSTGGNPPPVLDPFCGGGSIPLEAQRLGLEAHGSDLNPVAVLITKALIEIPPKFAGRPPVHPQAGQQRMARTWSGARGLAEDVRHYGAWIRDRAIERIGHLYPKAQLPKEYGGGEATVIAWLWARTVTCPNPACGARMPLVRSFALSTKKGKETWVQPEIDHAAKSVRFTVRSGDGTTPDGTVNRKGARCIVCNSPVPFEHVRAEGRAGRMDAQLMAMVAEGRDRRIYMPPDEEQIIVARHAHPEWEPSAELPHNPRDFKTPNYGMRTFADLFTPRQLVALCSFNDLVGEARERACRDAVVAGLPNDGVGIDSGGRGATAYADTVATYLSFGLSKALDRNTSLCTWEAGMDRMGHTFSRQAIAMTWDYTETNPLAGAGGDFFGTITSVCEVVEKMQQAVPGGVKQQDASKVSSEYRVLICTDPPYYDNIGYADLSDFFYVWLRRSLHSVYPDLFGTMLVPKAQELVATPYRFDGSKVRAEAFFEHGLGQAFAAMRAIQHPDYPLTVYYAFKQAESDGGDGDTGSDAVASTGWETMLSGLIDAGFAITGTWPMRSELSNRMIASGTNALASSIVLVCRPRLADAPVTTRREFRNQLKRELPEALRNLQRGNIAPVDLAQASIGPGMAVFSRYSKVLEVDGTALRVRTALKLINDALDEVVAEQDSEYDADTRWAIAWYEQFGMAAAPYGTAETLSRAKNTSMAGLVEAGLLRSAVGKVQLLGRKDLPEEWNPARDRRLTVWETTQHLARALETEGNTGAAALLARLDGRGDLARDLAYRLYLLCERKGWADDALAYNALVVAWPEVSALAAQPPAETMQLGLGL